MRIAALIGIIMLVLATLATSFPTIMKAQESIDGRSTNMGDHMVFTRELAQQSSRLEALADQSRYLVAVPERVARIEERLNILVQMVYALLAGVCGLLFKELWGALLIAKSRLKPTVTID